MDIEKLTASQPAMTDIHVTEGEAIVIRVYGALKKQKEIMDAAAMDGLLNAYLPCEKKEMLEKNGACDAAFSVGDLRCRLHVYKAGGLRAAAIRILPAMETAGEDPDMAWMEKLAQLDRGLVLFTGASGSGKSTAMARLLTMIGQKRACHVVTLEDPVEYILTLDKALVHQREIGRDVADFPSGVREALREDPDVIAVGEMRDAETISAALTAAETGHLVIGTLHSARAKDAVGRMIHAFPSERENEIRSLLSANLSAIAAQVLWRAGKETYLVREILTNVPAISHLIREGKEEQIPSYMEMGTSHMRTMRQAVYGLKDISEREREKLLKSLG